MSWSTWYECKFDAKGNLNRSKTSLAPHVSGIYAIATKIGNNYDTKYVGRSGSNIRGRIQAHLRGGGNKGIANLLTTKKKFPEMPPEVLCFAFLKTKEDKLVEAMLIDKKGLNRPLLNLIRARLPKGLRAEDVLNSPFED